MNCADEGHFQISRCGCKRERMSLIVGCKCKCYSEGIAHGADEERWKSPILDSPMSGSEYL